MNLKLIKVNYKSMKNNLNYDLFGEYMKIIGKKRIFTGGFGNVNLQVGSMKTKKVYNPLQSLDHKYQILTIIKRYHDTIRNRPLDRHKCKGRKSRNSLIPKKSSLLQPMINLSLIKPNNCNTNRDLKKENNTPIIKKNNTSSTNMLSPVSSDKESNLSLKEWFKLRKTSSTNSFVKSRMPFSIMSPNKTTKAFKDPFRNYNEEKYLLDKSFIRKRLANSYNFFQMNKNKYQTYKSSIAYDSKGLLRHSLLRINTMKRKDSNNS